MKDIKKYLTLIALLFLFACGSDEEPNPAEQLQGTWIFRTDVDQAFIFQESLVYWIARASIDYCENNPDEPDCRVWGEITHFEWFIDEKGEMVWASPSGSVTKRTWELLSPDILLLLDDIFDRQAKPTINEVQLKN